MSNPNLKKIIKLTQTQYDILSDGGTVGDYTGLNDNYLYLIQSDSPDLPVVGSGDKNKLLHTNASTGALEWSGNYVDLTSAQTISGAKTFKNNTPITFTKADDSRSYYVEWDGNALKFRRDNMTSSQYTLKLDGYGAYVYSLYTAANNAYDIGSKNYKFRDIYVGRGLRDGKNDSYVLSLPDSTSWTANKTIATTDQIPTVNDGTLTVQAEGTTKGTFTANQSTNTTINITKDDFVQSRTYTGLIGTTNEYKNAGFYFINVTPDSWNKEWSITYRIEVNLDNGLTPSNYQKMSSIHECYIGGSRGYYQAYAFFNSINDTSYRAVFYNLLHEVTEDGFNNNYPHKVGVELTSSSYVTDTNYKRTIKVTILNTTGCSATLLQAPEIPAQSTRSDYTKLNATYYPNGANSNAPGAAWRGDLYSQGLREQGDDNSTDVMYYHNQWLTVSSNLGLPGSSIFGYDTTGNVMSISVSNPASPSDTVNISTTREYNAGGFAWSRGLMHNVTGGYFVPSTTNLTHSYKVQSFDFRYTDNNLNAGDTNLTITADKFIYFRGTIGSDGLFYLAPFEVTYNNQTYKRAWTQEIPSSEDGYVYWLIGHPYSGSTASAYVYSVRLFAENPLYWFKDGKFREYDPGYTGIKRFI